MIIRYYHFDKINLKYFSDKLMLNQLCVRSMQVVSGRRRMGGRFLSQTTIGRRCLSCNPSHHLICISSTALIILLPLTQESGRLQYFGFSSMDCGIVIRDIGTRDSGGWTCRVSATVAGKHQVSADIVRLFVGETFPHMYKHSNHFLTSTKQCIATANCQKLEAIHHFFIAGDYQLCKLAMIWHRACQAGL